MKFEEGNKIEVFRRTKKQFRSWFPGEVVSANGDKYTIRYQLLLNAEGEPVVEKVSQRDVRPQPPPAKEEDKWVLGDIVEAFDLHCWKVGKVVKMLKDDRFVIRLFGSIQLKEFHESCLRVQQAWQNKQWIVIKKAGGDKKINRKRNYEVCSQSESSMHIGGESSDTPQQHPSKEISPKRKKHKDFCKQSRCVKTMKRNQSCDFQSYVNDAVGELGGGMRRTINNMERHERLLMNTLKQVDNISSKKANTGKRCIIRSSEMDVQMERLNNHPLDPFPMAVQVTEVSNECSVASCSGSNFLDCAVRNPWRSSRDVSHSYFEDAESCSPTISERKHLSPCHSSELVFNVHELEVHAYTKTMQALYASGPLSWEQESLLTNLRLSLHISTEEHLLHLRRLLSSQIL